MNDSTTPGMPPPIVVRNLGLATASLVLGIFSVTCLSILAGIPAIVLGAIALSKISGSAGRLGGKGKALAGVIMGGVSFLLIPFVAIFAAILLPAVVKTRETAYQAACANNVKQLATASILYASDHEGTLPRQWGDVEEFVGGKEALARLLTCPADRQAVEAAYEMAAPGKRIVEMDDATATVIIREVRSSHRSGRCVAYADGHVEFRRDAPE
jgi:prepilin-type processing-associated H-X9-DG protein